MSKSATRLLAIAFLGALLASIVVWFEGAKPGAVVSMATDREDFRNRPELATPFDNGSSTARGPIDPVPDEPEAVDSTQSDRSGTPILLAANVDTVVDGGVSIGTNVVGEVASPAAPAAAENAAQAGDAGSALPQSNTEVPLGWCSARTLADAGDDAAFIVGFDNVRSGSSSAYARPGSQSTLWQGVDATPYRGKRLSVSVSVQTPGDVRLVLVVGRAWQPAPVPWLFRTIAFTELPPGAAAGWTRLSAVGEIPEEADYLYYVVARSGEQPLWVDDIQLAEAGPELPLTGADRHHAEVLLVQREVVVLPSPFNLSFEIAGDRRQGTPTQPASYCGNLRIV